MGCVALAYCNAILSCFLYIVSFVRMCVITTSYYRFPFLTAALLDTFLWEVFLMFFAWESSCFFFRSRKLASKFGVGADCFYLLFGSCILANDCSWGLIMCSTIFTCLEGGALWFLLQLGLQRIFTHNDCLLWQQNIMTPSKKLVDWATTF